MALAFEEETYHMTIYGPSPGAGTLADWMTLPMPVSYSKGGGVKCFICAFVNNQVFISLRR